MKPLQCTHTHWGISNGIESVMGALWFEKSQCDKPTKQIIYLLLIDRLVCLDWSCSQYLILGNATNIVAAIKCTTFLVSIFLLSP
jgi:hypothetical protein